MDAAHRFVPGSAKTPPFAGNSRRIPLSSSAPAVPGFLSAPAVSGLLSSISSSTSSVSAVPGTPFRAELLHPLGTPFLPSFPPACPFAPSNGVLGVVGTVPLYSAGGPVWALLASSAGLSPPFLDSGATFHLTGDLSLFVGASLVPVDTPITGVDAGSHLRATGFGAIQVLLGGSKVTLPEAFYVPGLAHTLVSVRALVRGKGASCTFTDSGVSIVLPGTSHAIWAPSQEGLYTQRHPGHLLHRPPVIPPPHCPGAHGPYPISRKSPLRSAEPCGRVARAHVTRSLSRRPRNHPWSGSKPTKLSPRSPRTAVSLKLGLRMEMACGGDTILAAPVPDSCSV